MSNNFEELFTDEIYPFKIDENERNIEYMIQHLRFLHNFFNDTQIIDFISSHFYMINKGIITIIQWNIILLLTLPKSIIYSNFSNPKLIIESEDSLFDFINQVFTNTNDSNTEDDKFNNIFLFYENIEFSQLKDTTFLQFISYLDYTQITNILWKKLCKCFRLTNQSNDDIKLTRYYQFHEYHENYV